MRKWLDRGDWPFSRDLRAHPVDVEKVKAWAEIMLKPDPAAAYRKKIKAAADGHGEYAGMGLLLKARIQKTYEQTLAIRQRREADAGKLHSTDECVKAHAAMVHRAKAGLLGMGRSLANGLVGLDAGAIEAAIHARAVQICEELANSGDQDETH